MASQFSSAFEHCVRPASRVLMSLWRSIGRRDRGQSLVEFSLCLPFLVAIALGSADAARATYSYMTVTNAAAAGALYGSRSAGYASDTTGITNAALAEAQGLSPAPAVAVALSADSGGYQRVAVTVTYDVETAGWPGIPSPVTVSKTAVMRVMP